MKQREFNKLAFSERQEAIQLAARRVNGELNLFGADRSPIREIVEASDERELQQAVAVLEKPSCSHRRGCSCAFPPWYIREAGPAVRALARIVRQNWRAS